ncbi:MAG: transcriptional regulator MarR family [Frankiales bacterium]|nr:transcriptional regulator MarR family [Frankiales bacterium]
MAADRTTTSDGNAAHRPPSENAVAERDESLSEAFLGVARRLRSLSMQALAPWDVSPSHARAFAVLMRHGPMRLSDLSDHLRIAPRSATEVVDALQERGFVARTPDPHDRRAVVVQLTELGRKTGDAVRAARATEADRFFGQLSATDQVVLGRILRRLAE